MCRYCGYVQEDRPSAVQRRSSSASTDEVAIGWNCPRCKQFNGLFKGEIARQTTPTFSAIPKTGATDGSEKYCLWCQKLGHFSTECWSTAGLNTPSSREIHRLCVAYDSLRLALKKNRSRG